MTVYPTGWTASCDVEGCRWWAHWDTREKAEVAMARHTAHRHPEPPPEPDPPSRVVDLMEALEQSVIAAKAAREAAHASSPSSLSGDPQSGGA